MPENSSLRDKPPEVAIALLDERMTSLKEAMNSGHAGLRESVGNVDRKLDGVVTELRSAFASRSDLAALDARVAKLGDNQAWVIKIIIGAVLLAVLSFVMVKGGVQHP